MRDCIDIALVGCGYFAQAQHIPCIFQTEGLRLVAVIDQDQALAEAVGKRLGIPYFDNLEECFAKVSVDAVDICTSRHSHTALITLAADNGKHILTEKPLADADKVEEAEKAVKHAEEKNVKLMVGYMRRYDDDVRWIKKQIEAETLGKPATVISHFELCLPPLFERYDNGLGMNSGPQKYDSLKESVMEQSLHHLNIMRYWFGDVKKVEFARAQAGSHYQSSYEFELGVTYTHLHVARMGHGEQFWLYFKKGNIYSKLWSPHFAYYGATTSVFEILPGEGIEKANRREILLRRNSPYINMMKHFVRVLREDIEPDTTGRDAIKDLKLVNMIAAKEQEILKG
ncbi:MAG: Gfo/Idh/MocA family oxidoreductase [Dehalobacterium sp.]